MEMRKYIVFITFWCISLGCTAQTVDMNNRINEIKRDTTWIYAEATMKTLRDAEEGANLLFEANISEWVRYEFGEDFVEQIIEKARQSRDEIQMPRGFYFRVFVFVKKDSIVVELPKPEIKEKKFMLNEEELEMVSLDSFYMIEPYIKLLKNKGKLVAYGKFKNMPTDDSCYLFIYSKEGDIVAVLKNMVDKTMNLKTLEEDLINNYKNCGAIWFQLK